jgi:hypothetical protein
MKLSLEQKRALLEEGYVRVPGVVPRIMVDAALRSINHSVGQGMDAEQMPIFRARSYCPELQASPEIVGLLHQTPAWALAESAVGAGKLRAAEAGQIALRFPIAGEPGAPRPHLDGMYSPTNGVPEGTIQNFTMLVAVFLSDVPRPFCGNFTVWPGTHRLFEDYFREHGPESLLEGMPKVEMPEPMQVLTQPGDVVFCHYQLAHAAAQNASPHVRYATFFRLTHVEHALHKWETMTDIWLEWEGLREVSAGGPHAHHEMPGPAPVVRDP